MSDMTHIDRVLPLRQCFETTGRAYCKFVSNECILIKHYSPLPRFLSLVSRLLFIASCLSSGIGYQAVMVMFEMLFSNGAVEGGLAAATGIGVEEFASQTPAVADPNPSGVIPETDEAPSVILEMCARVLGVEAMNWMQMAALSVAATSVVSKEMLYHYTLKAGEGAHSDAVRR
jgi:hypothetical protein